MLYSSYDQNDIALEVSSTALQLNEHCAKRNAVRSTSSQRRQLYSYLRCTACGPCQCSLSRSSRFSLLSCCSLLALVKFCTTLSETSKVARSLSVRPTCASVTKFVAGLAYCACLFWSSLGPQPLTRKAHAKRLGNAPVSSQGRHAETPLRSSTPGRTVPRIPSSIDSLVLQHTPSLGLAANLCSRSSCRSEKDDLISDLKKSDHSAPC